MDDVISKIERQDLVRLIRQRERVLRSAAKHRSAELIADFENELGSEFAFDDDAVWAEAKRAAEAEVEKANRKIEGRCRELGIPPRFSPALHLQWTHRGCDNAIEQRRRELRRVATAKIQASEGKAIVEIEMACLQAQAELTVSSLTTEAARAFLENLPEVEALMPQVTFSEVEGGTGPEIELIATPNALRQRRYRERKIASRNAQMPLRKPQNPLLPDEGSADGSEGPQ
jgi:hypothetical protein